VRATASVGDRGRQRRGHLCRRVPAKGPQRRIWHLAETGPGQLPESNLRQLQEDLMTEAEDRQLETARLTFATVVRDYLPALGVLGLFLYGVLRLAYVFFYLRLRTTPEEVGYDYLRILAESIAGLVELVVLCAVAFAVLAGVYYMARILPLVLRQDRRKAVR